MKPNDSLLEFPCRFPIKALGKQSKEFDVIVLEIIGRHAANVMKSAIKNRMSKGGKYISVTITITAVSQNQLDAIYRDLSDCPKILMAL